MDNKIHFYSPGATDYISPTSLWAIARVTVNADGVRWLETLWAGGDEFKGMAVYTSSLDAAIAAEVLNQESNASEWQHYPLSDLDITEMMINVKDQGPEFCMMLVFGFSVDSFRSLVKHADLYRSLQFPESFPIRDDLDPVTNKVVLKFDESYFSSMNDYWHEVFDNYCEYAENINLQPHEIIREHARNAVLTAQVTTTPVYSPSSQYCVSTYSIEKQMWVVSSLAVKGAKPANRLH